MIRRLVSPMLHATLRRLGYRLSRLEGSEPVAKDGTGLAYEVQRNIIVSPSPVIFDVGAHVGSVATAYRRLFPDSTIHCFEPFPASYQALVEAVRGEARTSCHPLAISDSEASIALNANASPATNSLLPVDGRAAQFWGGGVLESICEVPIHATTIDEFCRSHNLDRIDILKLDVQGGEFAALKGAGRMLAEQRISLIYMELILVPTYEGQRGLREYLELLESKDYVLLDFYNPVRSGQRLLQVDLIFLRKGLT